MSVKTEEKKPESASRTEPSAARQRLFLHGVTEQLAAFAERAEDLGADDVAVLLFGVAGVITAGRVKALAEHMVPFLEGEVIRGEMEGKRLLALISNGPVS